LCERIAAAVRTAEYYFPERVTLAVRTTAVPFKRITSAVRKAAFFFFERITSAVRTDNYFFERMTILFQTDEDFIRTDDLSRSNG